MRALPAILAATLLAAPGCYLFDVENRPCTVQGECLPAYTCVEGLCVKSGVKQLGDACLDTGECVDGAVCADAYCDDSARSSCESPADCGPEGDEKWLCRGGSCVCQRVCRKPCDFPYVDKCKLGEMCWEDSDQGLGFCQEGHCGERDDGTPLGVCLESEVCLELNGPGSGLCNAICHILFHESCAQGTAPDGVLCCGAAQNCEHIDLIWDSAVNPTNELGICFDSGSQNESDPCSNFVEDNLFCTRGLFCMNTSCVKYCNLFSPGTQPACGATQICTGIPGAQNHNLPYGWCQNI